MDRRCDKCHFWQDCGDEESGECRIKPPTIHAQLTFRIDDIDLCDGFWPFTKSYHWCGEFSPRPTEDKQ